MRNPGTSCQSLVVTSNHGDYYVFPAGALEQFRATPQQRARIDAAAGTIAPNFAYRTNAAKASTQGSFASTPRTTLPASLQTI